jgi:hypothetical protein
MRVLQENGVLSFSFSVLDGDGLIAKVRAVVYEMHLRLMPRASRLGKIPITSYNSHAFVRRDYKVGTWLLIVLDWPI